MHVLLWFARNVHSAHYMFYPVFLGAVWNVTQKHTAENNEREVSQGTTVGGS